MAEQLPGSTKEKFELAQQTVETMERIIARTARSVATFSGISYDQACQEIRSSIIYAIVTGYDPQKQASPTTYAFYWLRAFVTETRRKQKKQAKLVEYPEEGAGEIASPDNDPAIIIEEDDFSQLIPARLIEEMNTAYERRDRQAMVTAAKNLAYHLVHFERGSLTEKPSCDHHEN